MSHGINKNNCEANYISKCWDFTMERKGYIANKTNKQAVGIFNDTIS